MPDPMRPRKQKRRGSLESVEQYAKVYNIRHDIKVYFELRRRFNGQWRNFLVLSQTLSIMGRQANQYI